MGLGLSQRGNFSPYCKYDARAGRWFKKGGEQGGDVDITNGFAALFDFEEIEVGYIHFPTGAAPQFYTQHISMGVPAQPADDRFKQGFKMTVALPSQLGGGVFELASTAFALIGEIDKLHTEVMAAPEAAQGLLPVVSMNGTTMVESKNGKTGQVSRNYAPNLSIVAWAQRPATMPKGPRVPAQQPTGAPQQQAQQQPGMFANQPQQQQAPAPQQPQAFHQNTAQDSRQQAPQPAAQPTQAGSGAAPSTGSERVAPPPAAAPAPAAAASNGGGLGFG